MWRMSVLMAPVFPGKVMRGIFPRLHRARKVLKQAELKGGKQARHGNGMNRQRRQGRVKFFDVRRGYGFITPDDGGADVFVHYTALVHAGLPTLLPGQRISYELHPAPQGKRPQAKCLLLLPEEAETVGDDEEKAAAMRASDDERKEAAE